MENLTSDYLNLIKEYIPGEQPKDKKYVKLNTNENPYPPSDRVLTALAKINCSDLRLYPDPDSTRLRDKLATVYNLKTENVFVGNGSDEVLSYSFLAFFKKEKPLFWGDVTYSFYSAIADLFQISYREIKSDDEFKFKAECFTKECGGIIIAHPNAPTGIVTGVEFIEEVLKKNQDKVVLVDEAYVDFGAVSVVPLVKTYKNLLVIHTFSKSRCFAGIRVGYAFGDEKLIQALLKVKNCFNSYPVNTISQELCIAALNDQVYYDMINKKIIATRNSISKRIQHLGFKVLDSKANFLFLSSEKHRAEYLFAKLKERSILVRHFNKKRIENFLRVTIGTENEMDFFVNTLEQLIKESEI